MAISIESKRAVTLNKIILKSKIIFPIAIPNFLFMYIPSISEPSKTAPFLIASPIPAPKKSPPNIAMSSLSSVIELKFSK